MGVENHEQALHVAAPLNIGGDWDRILAVQGRALDSTEVDVDYIEANILPDRMTDEDIIARWENVFTLSVPSAPTLAERRENVTRKLAETGGLSKPYLEQFALSLGFNVEFEHAVKFFRCGTSRCGDLLYDPLLGFRALCSDDDREGTLICSDDRSDLFLHNSHNDDDKNIRLYEEDFTLRQWVFSVKIFDENRESADLLISELLRLKPISFVEWEFLIS